MHPPASNVYGMEPSRPKDYDARRLKVIRDRWDQKAERWDADLADEHFHLNEDGAYRRFLEIADALVAERADFCRRHTLVDLGCGTGLVLAHFLDRFAAGVGVDISPRMLAIAARRKLPHAHFLEGNCFALMRHVAGAGALFSRGILLSHYGRRWAPLLFRQIHESLLPGRGFAILDFLNAAAREDYGSNPQNKTYYRAEQVEKMAKQAGFRRTAILGEPRRRTLLILAER
jgi:SAM-dependent methyltransferase